MTPEEVLALLRLLARQEQTISYLQAEVARLTAELKSKDGG